MNSKTLQSQQNENKISTDNKCLFIEHILCSPYLLVYETEEGNADLHAQVVQAEDGRLQQEKASGEEEAEAQSQEVSLAPLRSMEGVKGGNDPTQKLRLHRLGSLLSQSGK